MSNIVPRSLAPHAPADSMFPDNPEAHHHTDCKMDQVTYTCSCGLSEQQLKDGCFVRYDSSMHRTLHPIKKEEFPPITDMEGFLAGLKARCAALKISEKDEG